MQTIEEKEVQTGEGLKARQESSKSANLDGQGKLGKGMEGCRQVQRVEGEDDCGSTDRGRGGGTRWIWILDYRIQGLEVLEWELEG